MTLATSVAESGEEEAAASAVLEYLALAGPGESQEGTLSLLAGLGEEDWGWAAKEPA